LYPELLQPDDSLRESGRHRHHEPGARHLDQYPECKCAELRSRPKDAVDNNRSLLDKRNCPGYHDDVAERLDQLPLGV
jgi:hypothetical protein